MSLAANLTRPGSEPGLLRKVLRLNWALILLVCAIASIGFLMLYSIAGGSLEPWAGRQMSRSSAGLRRSPISAPSRCCWRSSP
jgi:rod shape determining protein RodA